MFPPKKSFISSGDDLGNNDFSLKNMFYISLIIMQLMYFIHALYMYTFF